jgi:hypothetical protein
VDQGVYKSSEADIEEIARRMRLVDGRIETPECKGEVDRVDVIEISASEQIARQPGDQHQDGDVEPFKSLMSPGSITV